MEINTVLITARFSSSRLPGKLLLPLGNFSVLGHSILRAKSAGLNPVLCTSTDVSDDALVLEASQFGIDFFRGHLSNKIIRWKDCLTYLELNDVHILDADDPYFDPLEILNSLDTLRLNRLDLVRTSERSDSGFASVGMSVTSKYMSVLARRSLELESEDFDVIPWGRLIFPLDKVATARNNYLTSDDNTQIRLTLDYKEDFELLALISKKFGVDAPRAIIEKYLIAHSELLNINESRTNDFLANKKVQLERNFQIES